MYLIYFIVEYDIVRWKQLTDFFFTSYYMQHYPKTPLNVIKNKVYTQIEFLWWVRGFT